MSAVDAAAPTYIEELFNMSPYLMLIQKSIYLQFLEHTWGIAPTVLIS